MTMFITNMMIMTTETSIILSPTKPVWVDCENVGSRGNEMNGLNVDCTHFLI